MKNTIGTKTRSDNRSFLSTRNSDVIGPTRICDVICWAAAPQQIYSTQALAKFAGRPHNTQEWMGNRNRTHATTVWSPSLRSPSMHAQNMRTRKQQVWNVPQRKIWTRSEADCPSQRYSHSLEIQTSAAGHDRGNTVFCALYLTLWWICPCKVAPDFTQLCTINFVRRNFLLIGDRSIAILKGTSEPRKRDCHGLWVALWGHIRVAAVWDLRAGGGGSRRSTLIAIVARIATEKPTVQILKFTSHCVYWQKNPV